MPSAGRPKPKFPQYDEPVMTMIRERGPIMSMAMRQELGVTYDTIDIVLKRLRSQGGIEYLRDCGWRLKQPSATRCPYPFRPWWKTKGGLWG